MEHHHYSLCRAPAHPLFRTPAANQKRSRRTNLQQQQEVVNRDDPNHRGDADHHPVDDKAYSRSNQRALHQDQ